MTQHLHDGQGPQRAVVLVEKVTYFGQFGYLNSSWARKKIIIKFLSSSRDKFTLLYHSLNLGDRCLRWFPAAMLVPIWRGTSMASPYKSLKFGGKVFLHAFHKKNCCDLNLGESLCIFLLFLFSESCLYLGSIGSRRSGNEPALEIDLDFIY